MKPKGKLLIIGGAEYLGQRKKSRHGTAEISKYEILKEILPRFLDKRLEIITSGSLMQEDVKKIYKEAFHRIGYLNPGFIQIRQRREAKNKEILERIENAAGIFFTGGDQERIYKLLNNTKLMELIHLRYLKDPDFLVAGTSAGAMVMSAIMICAGGKQEALYGKDLKLSKGLGLLQDCIIDTHFIKRGRFSRLAHAIIKHRQLLGIGLGEDTALIIKNGSQAECRGSGMVVIIDGRFIKKTNIKSVKVSEPVFVENLKVHLLVKDSFFSIKTRQLNQPTHWL